MLTIYNTLTARKETFKPLHKGKISLYVCGMTVYDYCHIGHGRVMVVFDVVVRFLRTLGFAVNYVRNITDIDDKIIKRAYELGVDINTLTQQFIQAMHEDEQALNVLPPDQEPRATQFIPAIIDMINTLEEKGYAYVAGNGDVYYRVSRFKNYGGLAKQPLEEMRAGARVAVSEAKEDPLDFALWKLAKPDEPSWDSPWGAGRPGWHIECSAMSTQCLGKQFDIHGGGLDLQFPHHQNEIAQSEAANGVESVNTWMHVGFVNVKKEKMSKSLGNFFTIREVLKNYSPEVVRLFLISSHYRRPLNYSTANLDSAQAALERFYLALRDLPTTTDVSMNDFEQRFNASMADDFNTPEALAVLFEWVKEINRLHEKQNLREASKNAAGLKRCGQVLGLLQQDPQTFLQGKIETLESEKIQALIHRRNQARAQKDWLQADRIRDELKAVGVELEDRAEGTIWRHI